jgi:hypothetical protein
MVPPPNLQVETESFPEPTDSAPESPANDRQIVLTPSPANDISTPIPLEWEQPLFAILDQTNPALRKQGLINMAVHTAAYVPRVQADCMKHLAFSLSEEDYAQFLYLIRNPALPVTIKANFLSDSLRIRRKEFSVWLAKSLINDPQPEISSLAVGFLNKTQNPN